VRSCRICGKIERIDDLCYSSLAAPVEPCRRFLRNEPNRSAAIKCRLEPPSRARALRLIHGTSGDCRSRGALEAARLRFIDENGGGHGVRLRKPPKPAARFLRNAPKLLAL
jgi:hypothetical protein